MKNLFEHLRSCLPYPADGKNRPIVIGFLPLLLLLLASLNINAQPTASCQNITLDIDGTTTLDPALVDNGSSSTNPPVSLSVSPNVFDCGDLTVGTSNTPVNTKDISVTLTVTDQGSNTATCSATVQLRRAPVAVCQDATLFINGSETLDPNLVYAGSGTSCNPPISLSVASNMFSCADLFVGTSSVNSKLVLVTLTVTDQGPNTSTCNAVVRLQKGPPEALCKNATVQASLGGTTLTAAEVDDGSTTCDTHPITNLSVSPNSFNCTAIGAQTVTLTATNSLGSSTCTATVTVQDITSPTAVCQNATVQVGQTLMPSQVDNGSSGNCTNPPSLSVFPNTFGCGNLGANTVTLTVDDNNGNLSTCSAAVTVESNAAPTAVCVNLSTNIIVYGSMAFINATDVDGGSSSVCSTVSLGVSPMNFTCSDLGPNTVTLTVTDDGNSMTSTCTAVVTVEDPGSLCCAGPVAMCNPVTVQLDNLGNGSTSAGVVGAGSTADCGIVSETVNPSSFDCDDIGPNTVTYTITDINGASSSCTTVVTVEDNMAPTAGCVNTTIQLDANGDGGQTAAAVESGSSDNCGTVNLVSLSPSVFSCSDVGGNTVILTVNDGNGNTGTCTATVTVEDNVPPVANCQDATVQLDGSGNGTLLASSVNDGSSDACGIGNTTVSPSGFDCDDLGGNTVTLMVTDNNSNSSTCTATATVEDNVPPFAVCQSVTVEFNGENDLFVPTTVWDDLASSDNCGATFLTSITPMNVTCDQLGSTIPVTVLINDGNGNEDDCIANVYVGGLPCGWSASPDGINCPDGNQASFNPTTGEFMVTSEGCYDPNYYSNTDSHGYAGTELCGDGEIIAEVTGITGSGFAGISMREDLSAGSKMLQLSIDGVFLSKRELRNVTGGLAFNHLFQTAGRNWLRLTRSGNQFTAQHSTDGVNWLYVIITNIDMPSCIQVGLFTENTTPSGSMTGTFDNVQINPSIFPLATPGAGLDIPHSVVETQVSVYPNPSNGEVFVDLKDYMGKSAIIRVFNNAGQLVEVLEIDEIQVPTQRIDLDRFTDGLFLINIQVEGYEEVTKKLMLTRN